MTSKITSHITMGNGETSDDTLARLLATQHERAVFKASHQTRAPYLWLTLTVPHGVGDCEVRDMARRLESAGAHVDVRQSGKRR